MFINRLRMSKDKLFKLFGLQSTLTLRKTRSLLRTPGLGDKSQSPCETHKEITEINSRQYGLSLLRKCEHFHAPKRNILLILFSRHSGHLVPNPGSHNTERHYDEGKQRTDFSIGCELENFLLMAVSFFRIVRNLMLAQ